MLLTLQLMLPVLAHVQMAIKTPLSYSPQEYSLVLGTAVLGGLASWITRVRRGDVLASNLAALIGELCIT